MAEPNKNNVDGDPTDDAEEEEIEDELHTVDGIGNPEGGEQDLDPSTPDYLPPMPIYDFLLVPLLHQPLVTPARVALVRFVVHFLWLLFWRLLPLILNKSSSSGR